jgi:putative membrane protein
LDTPAGEKPAADLRDYLAEERTFLAWVRTGLTLMGFGFVMARFGIFLEEIRLARGVPAAHPTDSYFGSEQRSSRPGWPCISCRSGAICAWSRN